MQRAEKIKIIASCLSGNVLEWFDFAVYGYLAPIIATQFFPNTNKIAAILLTYSVFAIGFLVRPLGSIIFGHIGDTYGRKTALVLSSFAMAIPTFVMGLLPTFENIGLAAPLLLILCRIFQGLSIGGEFTGSFVYLVEEGSKGRKGFFSCWADVGCGLGMILGSLSVAALHGLLTPLEIQQYGWRLPFVSGILLAIVAVFIRSQLKESREFIRSSVSDSEHNADQAVPIKQLFLNSKRTLFFATLLVTINALGFYTLVVFIPNQTVLLGKFPASQSYIMNCLVLFSLIFATFISASASDYFESGKIYVLGAISCILLAFPTFYALENMSIQYQLISMCLMAAAVGFCFGPRPLFLVSIFPPKVRFTAIALALNLGNAIFGGCAPLFATFLVERTGNIKAPAVMIIVAALLTLFAITSLRKAKNQNIVAGMQETV